MNDKAIVIRQDLTLTKLGDVLAKSGFFADSRQAAQAIVKVLAGQELQLGPIASMTGINVIQGKISLSANIIAAAIKRRAPHYDYRVKELNDKTCSIDFYQGAQMIGNSTFTAADAVKAGTKNMDKYPRNMLFARAISNGARWYCPDVFSGSPIYTPEELGAETDEDGNVINAEVTEKQDEQPPEPPMPIEPERIPVDQGNPDEMTYEQAWAVLDSDGNPYGSKTVKDLEKIKTKLERMERTEAEDYKLEAATMLLKPK